MRNECNIIRDILPLYVESMVSADTSAFVAEHLEKCAECRAAMETMKITTDPEQAACAAQSSDTAPLKAISKRWGKRNRIMIGATALITALAVLFATFFVGSGFSKRTDVGLADYSVSSDGRTITLSTAVFSSMGYTRGFVDKGGGVKPHYLVFYSTFGGLGSSLGAKHEFVLELGKDDTEIYFNRAGGGYELVLEKNPDTGEWRVRSNSFPV